MIYYLHNEHMPLYLLTLFAKNERASLSRAERNEFASLTDALVSSLIDRAPETAMQALQAAIFPNFAKPTNFEP